MKESKVMLIQYLTGAFIIVLGAVHFALLTFAGGGYDNALKFSTVVFTYTAYGLAFELLLAALTFHVFNGFRKVLTELHQGRTYERAVTWALALAGGATFLWGTRTVLVFLGVIG
jgi:succinate dehydrogenase hydrophobic anchor subunit